MSRRAALWLAATLTLGGAATVAAQPTGPTSEAPQLPQWREGPPTRLPPMPLPPRAAPARDLRWLYALGGVLIAAGVIMYNRKVKATLAAADAEDAERRRVAAEAAAAEAALTEAAVAENVPEVVPPAEEPPP